MIATEREIVPIERTKDGLPVTEDLELEFAPETAGGPALLLICTGWLKRAMRFKRQDLYELRRNYTDWNGRSYTLTRSPDAVAADPDGVTHYDVFVGPSPADDLCDCRGHAGCEQRGQQCKHLVALRHLVETQRI